MSEKDVWHEVEFTIGLEASFYTNGDLDRVDFYDAWVNAPRGNVPSDVKLLRVKLEVPESHWRLPMIRGKLKSELTAEYQAFLEQMDA